MPKLSLDINGIGAGAAEGREGWAGELPPTGAYDAKVKIITVGEISQTAKNPANRGKPKLSVGVELVNTEGGKYDGFIAWGNLNLIESGVPYVNQFLHALTDGSDKAIAAIEKAFYGGGITTDDRKHVQKIGTYFIGSPEGELPIRVSLKKTAGYFNAETKQTGPDRSQIDSYLMGGGTKPKPATPAETVVVEEDDDVDAEDIFGDDEE